MLPGFSRLPQLQNTTLTFSLKPGVLLTSSGVMMPPLKRPMWENLSRFFRVMTVGLHSAHGQTGHGAMRLIGERAEVGVNIRDQFVDENGLECSGGLPEGVHTAAATSRAASVPGAALVPAAAAFVDPAAAGRAGSASTPAPRPPGPGPSLVKP